LHNLKPLEIAQQMCIKDMNLFQKIGLNELQFQVYSKSNSKELAPNVDNLVEDFNRTSYWVATEIVTTVRLKERAKTMKRFIDLASNLLKLGNFHSMMAIISGLNLSFVNRLKKTWEELSRAYLKKFASLTEILSGIGNFQIYRKYLQNATLPVVPYMAIYLRDLTFIEEGNSTFVEGRVNFAKMRMISDVFSEVFKFQSQSYDFVEDSYITTYLKSSLVVRDEKKN